MNLISYLTDIYGYDTPIFLKDVRIGRKSKTAIREAFYRAVKRGELSRDGSGVYSVINKSQEFGPVVTFEKILNDKFIYDSGIYPGLELFYTNGYYSGLTFLNMIGISQQVPAILEVTTNKTSSKKRYYTANGRVAIIRKARTRVNYQNYDILQFLDMFHFITMREVIENKELIRKYIKEKQLSKSQFEQYIKLYSTQTIKKIVEGGIVDAFV